MNDEARPTLLDTFDDKLVVLAIRLVCLGVLGYWTLIIIRPFLAIMVWSAIIAVALYPIFYWLSGKLYGYRVLAAFVITLLSLLLMVGPATWLGLSLVESVRTLMGRLSEGTIALPPPPETIKAWPIGNKAYETWDLASTNVRALLTQAAPYLKPVGGTLLGAAGSFGINLLKIIAATIISGFLFIPGPALLESIILPAGGAQCLLIWLERWCVLFREESSELLFSRHYSQALALSSPEFQRQD